MSDDNGYKIDPNESKVLGHLPPATTFAGALGLAVASGKMKMATAWLLMFIFFAIAFGVVYLAYSSAGMSMNPLKW